MNIFRKSIYILPVLLAAAISTGCAEEELYERGQGDNADNYGVYFPNQTATTRIDISSADPREIKYKVRRTNGTEAIVVPVKVSATKEDDVAIDPDEIFEIEDIVFGPHQHRRYKIHLHLWNPFHQSFILCYLCRLETGDRPERRDYRKVA